MRAPSRSVLRRLTRLVTAEVSSRLPVGEWKARWARAYARANTRSDSGTGPRTADPGSGHQSSQSHDRSESSGPQDPKAAVYYANLELPYGADLEAVRAAWKRLVRTYHPDLHSTDAEKRRTATELVQGLNHAYEELVQRLQ